MVLNERSYLYYEDWKGKEYVVANPFSLAEFRCDYWRARIRLGIRGKKKAKYWQIKEMKGLLNGEN
jgi:hypothetical protein